jgi:hypothetical protein
VRFWIFTVTLLWLISAPGSYTMASSLENPVKKCASKSNLRKSGPLRMVELALLYTYAAGFLLAVVYKSVKVSAGAAFLS